MLAVELGRRYERLLYLSAPLSLVAMLILFIAYASTTQQKKDEMYCLEIAARTIKENKITLINAWNETKKSEKLGYGTVSYPHELSKLFIDYTLTGTWAEHAIENGCYQKLKDAFEAGEKIEPGKFEDQFTQKYEAIKNSPLVYKGIEIPQRTVINVFGTDIKIRLDSLLSSLQIALAPLLLLWLGSLYNTRYRETLVIEAAESITSLFPHIINIYPVGTVHSPRKKSWFAYALPVIISTLYSLMRISLLFILIAPAIVAYLMSLYLQRTDGLDFYMLVIAAFILVAVLYNILLELISWHASKMFPSPIDRQNRYSP